MRKYFKNVSFYIAIFLVIVLMVRLVEPAQPEIAELTFSELTTNLEEGKIAEITFINNYIEGKLVEGDQPFKSYYPETFDKETFTKKYLDPAMKIEDSTLEVNAAPPAQTPFFIEMLPSILMLLVFVGLWFVFMQQSQGGGSRVMSFGKSKAKLHKDDNKSNVSFDDIAGLEEEKEELSEIVDFLKNQKKYLDVGARIPKGILMVGPPGTGKTYLSKAVAGEAKIPFFSISGSDFVEMFVGVGASRVRDLFEQAKKNAPCIIFIDEIDAVGRKRGAGLGGGHDEREQTLNQLLVEMDGFGINEGIIMIAATNRPDILDPALLRPGRFDRQVVVGIPDVKGRKAILEVHSKNKPLAKDVELEVLARRTPGFTPADLENLLNEAALLTVRKRQKSIHMDTLEEAITKVIAGPEKKSRVISEKERRLTAFHEAGHAVVARLLPNTDPVHQVTIIPRGRAGGFTMILPKEDKNYMTKIDMEEHIVHLLGGRVAEELVLHDISTGASSDLQRATDIAKNMVTKYGMSTNLGPRTYGSGEEVFIGRDFSSRQDYSDDVASKIDREISNIIDDGYKLATKLLEENIDKLHEVANALLNVETLNADEFEVAFTQGAEAVELMPKKNSVKLEKKDPISLDKSEDSVALDKEEVEESIDLGKKDSDNKDESKENEIEFDKIKKDIEKDDKK